jgi:hypothetical protein
LHVILILFHFDGITKQEVSDIISILDINGSLCHMPAIAHAAHQVNIVKRTYIVERGRVDHSNIKLPEIFQRE